MKNNEMKCKDVLRWQCVLRCYFVPSKTFSRNKTHKIVHLVPLKTFSRNQIAGLGGTCYLHIGLHTISRQKSAAW